MEFLIDHKCEMCELLRRLNEVQLGLHNQMNISQMMDIKIQFRRMLKIEKNGIQQDYKLEI
ncbi:unnamed protein product [Paramecium sonneborni]|uniref:Uncharacterized protein n=1 Tax=Paramecium sonneborni TaxID=65129 RepID=A0A8S1R2D0_9CILI|nr:unnamed protein product [Paramecium sonneborni]